MRDVHPNRFAALVAVEDREDVTTTSYPNAGARPKATSFASTFWRVDQ